MLPLSWAATFTPTAPFESRFMRTPRVVNHFISGTTFVLVLVSLSSRSMGGAFEVLQQSARASGQAEAFAAQADDPSAIWYNPAG